MGPKGPFDRSFSESFLIFSCDDLFVSVQFFILFNIKVSFNI